MQVNNEEVFKEMSDAVVAMDEEKTVELAKLVIANSIDPYEAIEKGLSRGMERAGILFEKEEYFVSELLVCSDTMYAGLDVLRPQVMSTAEGKRRRVVIGVIEGDTHDIGKNLVKIMLEASRFEVFDLGRDVPAQQFVDKAKEVEADIIAVSTLMTTTMIRMGDVIKLLTKDKVRDRFKVLVGGGPITQGFADHIGADGYAGNAGSAAKLAQRLMNGIAT